MIDSWKKMDHNGYSAHQGKKTPDKYELSNLDFHLEPSDWQAFQDVLALNGQTHLVLIEAPLPEYFLPAYIRGGREAYETKFIQPIQAELSARGISFWRAQVEVVPEIPEAMWFDPQHLNAQGAVLLSNWLADKMAAISP